MTQFVDKSEDELKFYNLFNIMLNQTKIDIESYYETAYQSKTLGNILYEEKLMPIYKILPKKTFIKAYSAIIEGQKTFGSINSYIKILYAIFGENAEIVISKENPLHIKIVVTAYPQELYLWKVRNQSKNIITKDGKAIIFKQLLGGVTNRELMQVLKSITNAGTHVEFILNEGE